MNPQNPTKAISHISHLQNSLNLWNFDRFHLPNILSPPAEFVRAKDSETMDGASSTSVTSSVDPVTAIKSAAAHWTSDFSSSRPLFGVAKTCRASLCHISKISASTWGKSSGWRLLHSRRAAESCKAKACNLGATSVVSSFISCAHFNSSMQTIDLSPAGSNSKIFATFRLMEALLPRESPATLKASKSIWESPWTLSWESEAGFWRTRLAIAAKVWRMTLASSAEDSGSDFASSPANGINAPGKDLDKLEIVARDAAKSSEHGASKTSAPPFQMSRSCATWSGRSHVDSRARRTSGASPPNWCTRSNRSSSCSESPSWLVLSWAGGHCLNWSVCSSEN